MVIEPVEIKLSVSNYKYYESLGYEIKKKIGYENKPVVDLPQSLIVKFKDIPSNSGQKVKVICDTCGKEMYRTIQNENKFLNKNPIDTCHKCGTTIKQLWVKQEKYGTTKISEICNKNGTKAGRSRKYNLNSLRALSIDNGYILRDDLCDTTNIIIKGKYIFECCKHKVLFETSISSLELHNNSCPKCISEKSSQRQSKSTINEARLICQEKNYIIITNKINNCDDDIFYICNEHKEVGIQKTSLWGLKHYTNNCRICKHPKGEDCWNWAGGISLIKEHLRTTIKPWKVDSFKKYGYCCDITGVNNDVIIHHLYNFADIVNETFSECNLDMRQQVSDYIDSEIKMLEEKCLELHYKYGLGVCLSENIHKKFHSLYGVYNNTPEQYYEFKANVLNGSIII